MNEERMITKKSGVVLNWKVAPTVNVGWGTGCRKWNREGTLHQNPAPHDAPSQT